VSGDDTRGLLREFRDGRAESLWLGCESGGYSASEASEAWLAVTAPERSRRNQN
jgi:hypothetical protein